ncbi:MAG TPA: hypothetical protein VMU45_14385 [Candidatus Eisenbacteria bacterium]|nr:hypothetical protein [Candidatus Eisenbacteria bacterium]
MMAEAFRVLKQQRMALACALIVGLVLILLVHAPVIPVVAGCVLASGLAIYRSAAHTSAKGSR